MSENKQQFETDIVIYDISQGTVALGIWGIVAFSMTMYGKFTDESGYERIFYRAPQCSHCKRSTSYNNSVCLSVCPSVRHTPVLCQNDGA